jgi:DNA-directed RNA polymerase subunit RPC12/RpoP
MRAGPWGGLRTEADERAQGGVRVSSPQLRQFTCEQCGAVLSYAPGTAELVCTYCGHRNLIAEAPVAVVEAPLDPALREAAGEAPPSQEIQAKCGSCGADFEFKPPEFAGPCPFCGQPVVVDPGPWRKIRPAGVLPFMIGAQESRRLVGDWLQGLWFAPSGISEQARGPGRLHGVYLPYWTFDSRTRTRYVGRRGDVYYETQYVDAMVDGRRVRQAVQVPKIRWHPAAGQVARDFDDVLVLAGGTLPAHLIEALEPWDLDGVRPFNADYLTGFDGELYQLPVDQGFARGQAIMHEVIAMDIRADIGGDQQVIERMEVSHDQPTFKHVLLPVWVAAFQFVGRPYRFVVNGRTGEVHGERPWSFWKIAGAVVLGILLFLLVALIFSQAEALQDSLRGERYL